ncbi:hypothetical protein FA95DRAFT_1502991 [Auriscalpium vulgare]|uniref:Uncharacterized protein n=1 Tax=Auriscalpium vulgare TaxID=40419 RepID=A0ACB8R8A4_9AGAM|nr:hypothetical protein FA95DRAFT_1502991 [Auriscalpium vulgare]
MPEATTTPAPSPSGAAASAGIPRYLQDAYDHLKTACSGAAWEDVVQNWSIMEVHLNVPANLSTTDRPTQVKFWTNRGRQFDKPPTVGKAKEFAALWRKWWVGLQPEWRGTTWPLARPASVPTDGWGEVLKGGSNGFIIILITLSWWCGASKTQSEQNEWASAIEDVGWVLTHLVGLARAKKHSAPEELPDERPEKRCVHDMLSQMFH